MNKVELISTMSEETGFSKKDCEAMLLSLINTVKETLLHGGRVTISGFGCFERRERARKEAYNPVTKARIIVEPKAVPAFKPAKAFKELIATGKAE